MKTNFANLIKQELNYTETENGATSYKSSMDSVVDLFGQIGAFTKETSKRDKQAIFEKALEEDSELAMKTLFYALDIRGGLGARKTFCEIFEYVIQFYDDIAINNIHCIPEFGRWDDLIKLAYAFDGTNFSRVAVEYIANTLKGDVFSASNGGKVTLLAKWMPSENTSSADTRKLAKWLMPKMKVNYRKTLSMLRATIGIVETKLSQGGDINYEAVPSRAMLKYRNAFRRRDENAFETYLSNVSNGDAKINASTLYPYDLVDKVLYGDEDNKVLNLQWDALPNYMASNDGYNCIPIIDVSGSMYGTPMAAAIGIGMYISERLTGQFKNKFITFSNKPQLIEIPEKLSFVDKVREVSEADWGYNTNIELTFDLLLDTAVRNRIPQSEIPDDILIMSDMEFDSAMNCYEDYEKKTLFEAIEEKWLANGYTMPRIVFWNLDARPGNFPMKADGNCLLVSGYSPTVMKSIMNKEVSTALDLVKHAVLSSRYDVVAF